MAGRPSRRTFGVPLYSSAWVPRRRLRSPKPDEDGGQPVANEKELVLLSGGSGDTKSGIRNAVVLAGLDFAAGALAESPVDRFDTGEELPYRMAVHPAGEGFVCALQNDCKLFELGNQEKDGASKLAVSPSEKVISQLEGVGLQLALAFNLDGSLLAAGGEDGHLRILKWPSLEIILDRADAHDSVKDLDFSSDGKLLVSRGTSGPFTIWDVTSSTVVSKLSGEKGEIFGFCRFSRDNTNILYSTVIKGDRGGVIAWDSTSCKRIKTKLLLKDPISAFNISSDGKFLALGSVDGDCAIVSATTLQLIKMIKKAHLGVVTTLTFAPDSRSLLSTSLDSYAVVTSNQQKKRSGINLWIVIFILLAAIILYMLMDSEALVYLCPHIKKGEIQRS